LILLLEVGEGAPPQDQGHYLSCAAVGESSLILSALGICARRMQNITGFGMHWGAWGGHTRTDGDGGTDTSFLSRLVCYKPCLFHSFQVRSLVACRLIRGFITAFLCSHLARTVLTHLSLCYLDDNLTVFLFYVWTFP